MCRHCMTRTLAQVEKAIDSALNVNELKQDVKRIFVDSPKCLAMKALEELTPGGSEYYEDAIRCFKAIKEGRAIMQRVAVRVVQERNAIATQYADLADVIARIMAGEDPKKEGPQ